MLQNTDPGLIDRFKDDYRFLSNFYLAEFVWDGIIWPHSEAAYQAAKTLDRETRLRFSSMAPVVSKRAGNLIELREDWNDVKVDIMTEIVRSKFSQNPVLREKLLATENALIVEGNQHGDNFWGRCPPNNKSGKNWLGKILMQLRNEWQD